MVNDASVVFFLFSVIFKAEKVLFLKLLSNDLQLPAKRQSRHRLLAAGALVRVLCAWRDSNPHAFRHQILSLARLPITPHALFNSDSPKNAFLD